MSCTRKAEEDFMDQVKKSSGARCIPLLVAAALAVCIVAMVLAPGKAYAYGFTQTKATKNSATITWEDPNAGSAYSTTTGYTVSWGPEYGKITNTVSLDPTQKSCTITGLKEGTEYYAKVEYAYKSNSSGTAFSSYIGTGTVASRVVTPTGIKQDKWWYYAKSVDFTWKMQDAADKVEYRVYKTGSSKVVKKGSSNHPQKNYSLSKVSNNAVYTVQMRVHDQWGWSGWSKKAYLFTQPMINGKKTKVKNGKLTISWNKIKGATSYSVYVSTKEKSGYKKVATVKSSKSSYTLKKFKKAKINPKKKYFVYVVANKKVGKITYNSGKLYTYSIKGTRGSLNWTFN